MDALPLEERLAIEAVLLRYATAADTRDGELFASCFTEDVRADYGTQIGKFEGRAALIGHLQAMLRGCGPTLHFISNVVLSGHGDVVSSRCYTHAVVHIPGMEAPLRTAGIYDDRLHRTQAGWRIAARVYSPVA